MAAGGDGPGGTAEERPLPSDLHRPRYKLLPYKVGGLAKRSRSPFTTGQVCPVNLPGRFLAPERSPGVLLWAGRVWAERVWAVELAHSGRGFGAATVRL